MKRIVTSKRVCALVICVFVASMACGSPFYVVNKLGMAFIPSRNRTLLGIISADNRQEVETICFIFNSFVLPLLAFIFIMTCTVILIISLNIRSKWHKDNLVSSKRDICSRHEKIGKMVLMISFLFICCFIPHTVTVLAIASEPDLFITGKHIAVAIILSSFGLLLESINSSMNIVIYYYMSVKYRESMSTLLCKGTLTQ